MKKITIEQAKAEFPFAPDTAMPFIKSGYDLAVERHNRKKAKKSGTRYYGEISKPCKPLKLNKDEKLSALKD